MKREDLVYDSRTAKHEDATPIGSKMLAKLLVERFENCLGSR